MRKIIFLKGLPASGKSTYAKELVARGYKRVNKDDLRDMLDSYQWSKSNEKFILNVRDKIIIEAMQHGYNIVVDDTNFNVEHQGRIKELMDAHNCFTDLGFHRYELEEKLIECDVEECIRRDDLRGGRHHVGAKVIRGMYDQYIKKTPPVIEYDPKLPNAIICDIDGTLSEKCDRNIFDYTKVIGDKIVAPVAEILDRFPSYKIIIVSGRDDDCMPQTKEWFNNNGVFYSEIYMRKTGDKRQDAIVKKEIYDNHIKGKYNILFVLDDRDQVVNMWREQGLRCFQVAEGNF